MNLKNIIKKNKSLFRILSNIKNYKSIKQSKYYEDFFSNVLEGNVVVNLNNIPGNYEFDARSHILKRVLLEKEYEPKIVKLILENTNSSQDAINIGANIGLYSNLLAFNIDSNKKVLAIEPTPSAYKLLNNNIHRNSNVRKIITFNGIATDDEEEHEINIIEGKEEYSSLGNLVHTSVVNEKFIKEKVKGVTIDSLVNLHKIKPGIMVIDVEGAELNVLKGATETLRNYHPIIISELDDALLSEQNSSSKELIKFLKEFDYKIVDTESNFPDFPFCGNIIAST